MTSSRPLLCPVIALLLLGPASAPGCTRTATVPASAPVPVSEPASSPAKAEPVPEAEREPPPEPLLPPSAESRLLALTPEQLVLVETHARHAVAAGRGSGIALCEAVRSSGRVADVLRDHLFDRRDALFDSDEYDTFSDVVDTLAAALVGVYLVVGAETFYAGVHYGKLAALAAADERAAELLGATHAVMRTGYPVWIDQTWDLGGCTDLGEAVEPLRGLAAAWPSAPACLKETVGAPLREAIGWASGGTCFCKSAADVRAAAKALKPVLESFDLAGPKVAARVWASATHRKAKYKSSCVPD